MAINLQKSQGISLDKGLKDVMFTVSWDSNVDVDIHAMVLTDGRGVCDEDFVFYGNLNHPSGAINHSGDIRDGSHAVVVDDEYITISLDQVPSTKTEIVLSASIHNANLHGLHFGKVAGAVAKIIDKATNEVLATFNLDRDLLGEHTAELARLVKANGTWKFENVSKPAMSLESLLVSKGF